MRSPAYERAERMRVLMLSLAFINGEPDQFLNVECAIKRWACVLLQHEANQALVNM